MESELEFACILALSAVRALGDRAPDWSDVRVQFYDDERHDFTMDRTDMVHVSLRSTSGLYDDEAVYFTNPTDGSLALSVLVMVDGIQDHAIETMRGEALPPCPGHVHPLVPRIVDGVPKWVCMVEGAARYARDILPNFDPSFETPEEYLLLREAHG